MILEPTAPVEGQPQPTRRNRMLWVAMFAIVVGGLLGSLLHESALAPPTKHAIAELLNLVARIYLRLLRMLVAPLILSVLVVGISQMGSLRELGKAALAALIWFLTFSLTAILIGLLLANIFQPGLGFPLARPDAALPATVADVNIFKIIEEMVPASIFEAGGQNKIIQIVVFAIFAGVALGSLGEKGAAVRALAEQISQMMFKIAGYVLRVTPIAVFSAAAATSLEHGFGAISALGKLVTEFYAGLLLMAALISIAGFLFLGGRMIALLREVREPVVIAFSTASSEATLPSAFAALGRFGVPPRLSGFLLPLGYSFNLDGTLIYSSLSVMFIAQAYGIDLPLERQLAILLFLLLINKGAAGVPRGALIGMALTLETFGLPVAGIALILGVDAIMDMGRTAINVFGNMVATASVAKITRQGQHGP